MRAPLLLLLPCLACEGGVPTDETDPLDTDAPSCASDTYTTPAMVVRQQSAPDALFLTPVDSGTTGFGAPEEVHPGLDSGALTHPILADFDGDGSLEVIANRDGVWMLDWNGCTESWEPTQVLTDDVRIATTLDADLDGDLDVVTFQLDTGVGPLLVNDGSGGFTVSPGAYDLSSAFGGYRVWPAQHALDADGDGDEDFAISVYDTGAGDQPARIYVVPSNGDGTFGAPVQIGTTPYPSTGIDLGDLDGDGDADIVAGLDDDGDPGQVWLFRNRGDGTFEPAEELYDVSPGEEPETDDGAGFGRIQLWDRTGDGRADLFLAWEQLAGDGMVTTQLLPSTATGLGDPVTLQTADVGRSTWVGLPR